MVGLALSPGEIVNANLLESMRSYACTTSAGETREYPGIAIASSGLRYSVFNSAMLTSPVQDDADLARRLSVAGVHFATRDLGWTLWLYDGLVPSPLQQRVDQVLAANGMRLLTMAPGMYAEELRPARRTAPELKCLLVEDAKTRFDFCDVACIVFSLPFRVSYQIYAEPGYWTSNTRGYVAYRNGKPVSVIAIVPAEGAAGVYSLGTLPQHQRRGYGETLMRFALEDVRMATGFTRTVLQATDKGYPLYNRLGYRTVTRFRIYERVAGGCDR